MSRESIKVAPNYTTAALVFAGLNLMWILCLVWALAGYLPALLLSGALHHLITLRFHRP